MKKFKIIIGNPQDFAEVVDSIADLFEAGIAVAEKLEDGFQVEDLLVIIQQYDNIKEVINDFPTFLDQFTHLTGENAVQAVLQARQRVIQNTGELGKISEFIFALLLNLASAYKFAEATYLGALEQLNAWKALKGILNPDGEGDTADAMT